MRSTVLFAVVLVLNIGGGDGPVALAGTDSTAAPQSTAPSSATQEVPPPDLQGFPIAPAPDDLATVALPDTFSAVTALFERLPPEVAGHRVHRSLIAFLPSVQLSATARIGG